MLHYASDSSNKSSKGSQREERTSREEQESSGSCVKHHFLSLRSALEPATGGSTRTPTLAYLSALFPAKKAHTKQESPSPDQQSHSHSSYCHVVPLISSRRRVVTCVPLMWASARVSRDSRRPCDSRLRLTSLSLLISRYACDALDRLLLGLTVESASSLAARQACVNGDAAAATATGVGAASGGREAVRAKRGKRSAN